MTTYTLQDLMYAKGTSEPVRQALQAQAAYIAKAQALIANLTEQRDIYRAENERLREVLKALLENGGDYTAKRDAARAALGEKRD